MSIIGNQILNRRNTISPIRPDEVARKIVQAKKNIESGVIADNLQNYTMNVTRLNRIPKTTTLTVGPTPSVILRPPHKWPYILSNPSLSIGVTSNNVLLNAQTLIAVGNTQSNPLGVSSYAEVHVHMYVTNVVGAPSINFYTQSKDPGSGLWFDVQTLFSGVSVAGKSYSSLGNLGIVTDFAIRWDGTIDNANKADITFTVTLKGGTEKAAGGLARTIYIGGPDVSSTNGLPLFEGQDKTFHFAPEILLYAVSGVSTTMKIFTT